MHDYYCYLYVVYYLDVYDVSFIQIVYQVYDKTTEMFYELCLSTVKHILNYLTTVDWNTEYLTGLLSPGLMEKLLALKKVTL
jgi:hypothetical protein